MYKKVEVEMLDYKVDIPEQKNISLFLFGI